MEIRLVGSVGVAVVELVGGPLDGQQRMAVVGAPVVEGIAPKEKKKPEGEYFIANVFFAASNEGEEWKQEANVKAGKAKALFAVYLPESRDGKATGYLRFAGAFEHIPLPK